MPIPLSGAPQVNLDDLDQWAASAPVTQDLRGDVIRGFGHSVEALGGGIQRMNDANQVSGTDALSLSGDANATVENARPSTFQPPARLTSEQANETYGVPGYLRFNGEVNDDDAAWQANMAHEAQFRDTVLAHSNPDPLTDIGNGLLGAVIDPVNVSLAAATSGLGEGVLGAFGWGEAADSAAAITRVGRLSAIASGVPRTFAGGAIENAPFVAANAGIAGLSGDDYDAGDALRDLAAGAVLHTGIHSALRLAGELARPVNPDGLSGDAALAAARSGMTPPEGQTPASGPETGPGVDFNRPAPSRADLMNSTSLTPYTPEAVDALPPAARYGAWALAMDQASRDEPVNVAELIAREQTQPDVGRLNENTALSDIPSFRPAADATAVTTRGTEIPVRYGLAELSDLVTSHTDDLQPNPAFPAELQPRDRARAGAMARNLQLEQELNPKLLISDVGAGQGAPIVSPGGVVESGNGRTIALRRAAAKGAPAYDQYKAELAKAGYDPTGMRQPVLVRMRTEPLSGSARSALAHEMNADVTERMSAGEQASADAARMPGNIFDQVEEGRSPTTSRGFTRAFIAQVAPDQVGAFTDRDGRLSPEGARRIKAAVVARAYGDQGVIGQLFEGEETPARKLGEALAEAAPAWAKLRQLAAAGEIPRILDLTPALTSAMDLVRHAARSGEKLADLVADRSGQQELFGGESISPFTEAFLRLFYRDEHFTMPLAAERIAAALKDYARQAGEVKPGPDLFGDTPDEATARGILRIAADKYAAGDAGNLDVRAPGRSDGGSEPARPYVVDVRQPVEDGAEPGGEGVSGEGQPEPGGAAEPERAGPVSAGDLWRLSQPELERLLQESSASDHEKLVMAFGSEDRAKLFERLDRKQNASDPVRADEGSREFEAEFGNLTPEQERLAYGIGETEAQGDDIRQVLRAHSDVMQGDDPDQVAYYAALGARGATVEELAKVPEGNATSAAQAAFVRLQLAYEEFQRQGIDAKEIPARMAKALVEKGGWHPEQAAEFMRGFAEDMVKQRQQPEAQAALERPAQKALAAPSKPQATTADGPRPAGTAQPKVTGQSLIAGDADLRALRDDTDRLAAANGLELETADNQNPDIIAEALRAAAVCLVGELG